MGWRAQQYSGRVLQHYQSIITIFFFIRHKKLIQYFFQYHLEKECCFQIVNCTFEHCQEKMERHTLSIHGEICGYKPVTCEYCSIICLKLDIAVRIA